MRKIEIKKDESGKYLAMVYTENGNVAKYVSRGATIQEAKAGLVSIVERNIKIHQKMVEGCREIMKELLTK